MREIKFRAWDKKNKKMISHEKLFSIDCSNEFPFLPLPKNMYSENLDVEIMQYTGMHDSWQSKLAIKALENQPKYEKALAMACELVPKSDWCYTKEHVCDKRGCTMCMIAYFKKKAGIEVDNE